MPATVFIICNLSRCSYSVFICEASLVQAFYSISLVACVLCLDLIPFGGLPAISLIEVSSVQMVQSQADPNLIYSISADTSLRCWDIRTQKQAGILGGENLQVFLFVRFTLFSRPCLFPFSLFGSSMDLFLFCVVLL